MLAISSHVFFSRFDVHHHVASLPALPSTVRYGVVDAGSGNVTAQGLRELLLVLTLPPANAFCKRHSMPYVLAEDPTRSSARAASLPVLRRRQMTASVVVVSTCLRRSLSEG